MSIDQTTSLPVREKQYCLLNFDTSMFLHAIKITFWTHTSSNKWGVGRSDKNNRNIKISTFVHSTCIIMVRNATVGPAAGHTEVTKRMYCWSPGQGLNWTFQEHKTNV